MKKTLLGAFAALFLAGAAHAQVPAIPQVTNVGPNDLFPAVVGGNPSGGNQYAKAAQISGVAGYAITTPLTAFSLTFGNSQQYYLITPAGTLATGTFTMAPNPGDGQRACIRSTQTQTAVTITANTGQTMGGTAVTAMVANTTYCWFYAASLAAWEPI